eukprot:8412244-Alexandrium_andersonii.AAC.1
MGKGRDSPQRLTGAPSEPPPKGRHTMCEDAFTQQLGAQRSGVPSRLCRSALVHSAAPVWGRLSLGTSEPPWR